MIRRRLTLKRVDPWSVLKFGFVVNIAIMLVAMLGFWILWIVIGRLGLVDQFCDSVGTIVLDLEECSLNGGNIFRTLLFLGVLGVVVQTGIMVFGAFLYNLIADLTGGLGFSFLDESADAGTAVTRSSATTGSQGPVANDRDVTGARTGAAAGAAASSSRAGGPPDQSSNPRRPTPDGPPPSPTTRPDSSRPTPSSASSPGPSRSGAATEHAPSTRPGDGAEPHRSGGSSGPSLWGDPGRSDDRR